MKSSEIDAMRCVRIGDTSPAKPTQQQIKSKTLQLSRLRFMVIRASFRPLTKTNIYFDLQRLNSHHASGFFLSFTFILWFFSCVLLIRNNIKSVQKLISQIGIRDCVCLAPFNRIQLKRALLMTIYELLVAIHFEIPKRAGPTPTVCLVSKSRH